MIKAILKRIRGKWYIASGPIGFPTTSKQDECFSRYIKDTENITITTEKTDSSFCRIVPHDTGEDYLCEMYDSDNDKQCIDTVNICYDFFVKLKIDGEFYFNRTDK